jgi:hypothetical protein
MATGWPMKTTYADGDVYSAADVNDITGTINLLQTSTLSNSAGKNFIVGGGFDNWQRGTSGAITINTVSYPAADRWWALSAGATATMSRQTADTQGLQYGMRFGRNSGQTNTGAIYAETVLETNDTFRLAGRTITYSFYAKAGANASLTALTPVIYTGTGTDQGASALFVGGWTGGAFAYNTPITVTTTMARYSVTITLASTVREVTIGFTYTPTGTAGANEWYQIEGVQVEYGSYPTTFSRAGGTIQGELAACRRYLPAFSGDVTYLGYTATTNFSIFNIPFDVRARVAPTGITASGNIYAYAINTASAALTPSFWVAGTTAANVSTSNSATAGQVARLQIASGGLILFTGCEL